MSKHVFRLGIGLAMVALAFVMTDRALRIPRDAWRWESAQRIREGMTRADVVRALGPPGNSRKLPLDGRRKILHWLEVEIAMPEAHCEEEVETWEIDGGTLVVTFFRRNGRVRWAQLVPDPPAPATSPLDRLRPWLGW
jgi:hypothetical protein